MSLVQSINGRLRGVPAWPIYIIGALPPAWLLYQGLTGGLGADPVKAMERQLGLLGLKLIVAGLCITPLRRFAGLNLIRYRRAIGLVAFSYVLLHFLTWIVLDMGLLLDQALADIIKRPYVTIGMIGLVALIPLAATSNNWAVRRLGAARWQKLHKLTYLAAAAGAVHYVWLVKSWPLQPLVYAGIVTALLVVRLPQIRALAAAPARSLR
jgi:methionine sulfoxide reductase heme-binding subunit